MSLVENLGFDAPAPQSEYEHAPRRNMEARFIVSLLVNIDNRGGPGLQRFLDVLFGPIAEVRKRAAAYFADRTTRRATDEAESRMDTRDSAGRPSKTLMDAECRMDTLAEWVRGVTDHDTLRYEVEGFMRAVCDLIPEQEGIVLMMVLMDYLGGFLTVSDRAHRCLVIDGLAPLDLHNVEPDPARSSAGLYRATKPARECPANLLAVCKRVLPIPNVSAVWSQSHDNVYGLPHVCRRVIDVVDETITTLKWRATTRLEKCSLRLPGLNEGFVHLMERDEAVGLIAVRPPQQGPLNDRSFVGELHSLLVAMRRVSGQPWVFALATDYTQWMMVWLPWEGRLHVPSSWRDGAHHENATLDDLVKAGPLVVCEKYGLPLNQNLQRYFQDAALGTIPTTAPPAPGPAPAPTPTPAPPTTPGRKNASDAIDICCSRVVDGTSREVVSLVMTALAWMRASAQAPRGPADNSRECVALRVNRVQPGVRYEPCPENVGAVPHLFIADPGGAVLNLLFYEHIPGNEPRAEAMEGVDERAGSSPGATDEDPGELWMVASEDAVSVAHLLPRAYHDAAEATVAKWHSIFRNSGALPARLNTYAAAVRACVWLAPVQDSHVVVVTPVLTPCETLTQAECQSEEVKAAVDHLVSTLATNNYFIDHLSWEDIGLFYRPRHRSDGGSIDDWIREAMPTDLGRVQYIPRSFIASLRDGMLSALSRSRQWAPPPVQQEEEELEDSEVEDPMEDS